ncbi:MAG: hypothetical protein MK066_07800 [Crocinitomicaceae bacterium]|nr:hypothetical protein [Crocinitomicaceae bacterium]
MQLFLTLVLCWMSFMGLSQDYDISWGELKRKQGSMVYLLPNKKDQFYALRWAGKRVLGSYRVSRHKNLEMEESLRLKLLVEESIANFEGARIFNDELVVFLSDKKDGRDIFYMQRYSESLEKIGGDSRLASYELDRKKGKGVFDIRISSNGEYLGVIWEITSKKNGKHTYGFCIYDQQFEVVNEGEYLLPYEAKYSRIHDHHISNTGDYFLCLTEYAKSKEKSILKSELNYKSLHVYHISDAEGWQDLEVDLNGKRIVAMSMFSDTNNIFTITGIYGEMNVSGVSGVFYRKTDLKDGKTIKEGFRKFEEQFITQDWSERDKKRALRLKEKGKEEPNLYNYRMRDVTFLEDGSIVGAMEQYYVQVRSSTDGRSSQTSNIYYYYYNDIISYRINVEGEFEWVQKVKKYQVSINDGGPYSSFESFIDDGKIYYIFNDNTRNYDLDGNFIDKGKVHTANYGRKRNVVAIAGVDINTGEKTRKALFDRSETNTLAVPKLCQVNYSNGQMLIYSVSGRKERIGVLKFKE